MNVVDIVNKIEGKVMLLATKLKEQREQNAALDLENQRLKVNLSKREEMIGLLKTQVENTQRALDKKQEQDPEHSKKLRKQIDKYIEEIDRCISWMEKA